jgi:pimeloyl-ACP methyl ester carboxylesterase
MSTAVPVRLASVAIATLVVAYLAICFNYAERLTQVQREELAQAAAFVASTHEDVSFGTADGLTLRGWWFPAPEPRGRAAVLVHGKDANRIDSSWHSGRIAHLLIANGYSTLLFDLRGHGESDGLRWGLGEKEALDVAAAVDLAAQKAGVPRSRVALLGESMGAGSVLMSLAHVPDVGAVVTDSSYADGNTVVSELAPVVSGLPAFFTPGMVLMAKLFFALDLATVRPVEQVRAQPERAFLFIHCEDDSTVYVHHAHDLRAASAAPETELWIAPDCGHVRAFSRHPAEWESRVLTFLERELGR